MDELRSLQRAARRIESPGLRDMLDAGIEFLLVASDAAVEHRLPMIYDG